MTQKSKRIIYQVRIVDEIIWACATDKRHWAYRKFCYNLNFLKMNYHGNISANGAICAIKKISANAE